MGSDSTKRSQTWALIGVAALLVLVGVGISIAWILNRASPILKGRIEETLSARFKSRVELKDVAVSATHGFEVTGRELRIAPPYAVVADGATQPLIVVERFSFHISFLGLFVKPTRVGKVYVTGMTIHIPPKEQREQSLWGSQDSKSEIRFAVSEIICENSHLIIATANPAKDPKVFDLRHIELHEVGPDAPLRYEALLTNAIPRGDIRAKGTFGPWQAKNPGDSQLTGHYTFDHADLNTIKGIGGMLSSEGDFRGRLNRIDVKGWTETPDFRLDTANHPLPLHTDFQATVDGLTGDTYLEHIEAKLRNSAFVISGEVVNIKGKGHRIDLDVEIPSGHLQDFLELAVKTKPVVMTAVIGMNAKLQIPPGKEPVPQKIGMTSTFGLHGIRFSNRETQEKIDQFSLRARGDPEDAKPGASLVNSTMKGTFTLQNGGIHFSNLAYAFPGARVQMAGVYSLNGQVFDFRGKILTDAKPSEMVVAKWKRVLLRAADFVFHRQGGGAEIPFTVSGTKSAPKFGVVLFGKEVRYPIYDSSSRR